MDMLNFKSKRRLPCNTRFFLKLKKKIIFNKEKVPASLLFRLGSHAKGNWLLKIKNCVPRGTQQKKRGFYFRRANRSSIPIAIEKSPMLRMMSPISLERPGNLTASTTKKMPSIILNINKRPPFQK